MKVAHAFYGPKERGVFLLVRFLCTSKENGLARGCEYPQVLTLIHKNTKQNYFGHFSDNQNNKRKKVLHKNKPTPVVIPQEKSNIELSEIIKIE